MALVASGSPRCRIKHIFQHRTWHFERTTNFNRGRVIAILSLFPLRTGTRRERCFLPDTATVLYYSTVRRQRRLIPRLAVEYVFVYRLPW